MPSRCDTSRRGLHVVTPDEPRPKPTDEELNRRIAEGVLKFQSLQHDFDAEALSRQPDMQRVAELVVEMNTLRRTLNRYGVRVRS